MGAPKSACRHIGGFLCRLPVEGVGAKGAPAKGPTARNRPVNFLLDTNVVSEWTKPRPNPGVMAWLSHAQEDQVFLSVVTVAELRYGIERLPQGRRRRELDKWLQSELPRRFDQRIILIDGAVCDEWGRITARMESRGRPMHAMDALIAATSVVHGLTLVTRNAQDFHTAVQAVLNPWT